MNNTIAASHLAEMLARRTGISVDEASAFIGEYFNVDPVVIRLLWVVFCCLGGSGIIAYIIAAIIIPSKTM